MRPVRVFLVGNPNCGKTSLFNAVTGERRHVGNWPGVTVDRIEGLRKSGDVELIVTDLPGTYSLTPASPEERVVLEQLDEISRGIILNVIDAGNLERNLFLTMQLLELGLRPWLVFNCYDTLRRTGAELDLEKVARLTGCPTFATVARSGEGVDELCTALAASATPREASADTPAMRLPRPWQTAVEATLPAIGAPDWPAATPSMRLDAIQVLIAHPGAPATAAGAGLDPLREKLLRSLESAGDCVTGAGGLPCRLATDRYDRISRLLKACHRPAETPVEDNVSPGLDRFFTSRVWGLPIFAFLVALMFWTTFSLGALPADAIEAGVEFLRHWGAERLSPGLGRDLLLDGIVTGLGGILVFLPNVLILFLWISLLEDSGYMARAAFLMDRLMQMIGLHGRAFVPLLMGFGCNVPAIMSTRLLDDPRQRRLVTLLMPLVGCSARLPVLVLFCGIFFPQNPGLVLTALYLINLLVLVGVGRLLARLMPPLTQAPFMLEMPPYRLPTWRSLRSMLWDKTWHFLEKASGVILAGTILIWSLTAFPREVPLSRPYAAEISALRTAPATPETAARIADLESDMARETMERRYMGSLGRALEPLVRPLGFGWREAVSLVPGFLAKESIVSTLAVLYNPIDKNLGTAMRREGVTPAVGFLFMLFTLLYVPCLPTVGVIWRETRSFGFTLAATLLPGVLAWSLTFATSLLIGAAAPTRAAATATGAGSADTVALFLTIGLAVWYLVRRLRADLAGESPCTSCQGTSCRIARNDTPR
ncbi:MAG TPA: ferrous iron transport protein B [Candidatus Ozemobacteraceae bacterium]|nr:ferrous iron transport protein B [Candidatus Ozemobacteraceae bacterium]